MLKHISVNYEFTIRCAFNCFHQDMLLLWAMYPLKLCVLFLQ